MITLSIYLWEFPLSLSLSLLKGIRLVHITVALSHVTQTLVGCRLGGNIRLYFYFHHGRLKQTGVHPPCRPRLPSIELNQRTHPRDTSGRPVKQIWQRLPCLRQRRSEDLPHRTPPRMVVRTLPRQTNQPRVSRTLP